MFEALREGGCTFAAQRMPAVATDVQRLLTCCAAACARAPSHHLPSQYSPSRRLEDHSRPDLLGWQELQARRPRVGAGRPSFVQVFQATQPSRKLGALLHALDSDALVPGGDIPLVTVQARRWAAVHLHMPVLSCPSTPRLAGGRTQVWEDCAAV